MGEGLADGTSLATTDGGLSHITMAIGLWPMAYGLWEHFAGRQKCSILILRAATTGMRLVAAFCRLWCATVAPNNTTIVEWR